MGSVVTVLHRNVARFTHRIDWVTPTPTKPRHVRLNSIHFTIQCPFTLDGLDCGVALGQYLFWWHFDLGALAIEPRDEPSCAVGNALANVGQFGAPVAIIAGHVGRFLGLQRPEDGQRIGGAASTDG